MMNGIGDAVLAIPALRALAQCEEGRVTLITADSSYAQLFDQLKLRKIVRIHHRDSPGIGRSFHPEQWLAELDGPCDLFISLNPWHSSSVSKLLMLLDCSRTIGFHPEFHVRVPLNFDKHSADLAFDAILAWAPNLRVENYLYPLAFPDAIVANMTATLAWMPKGAKILTVHHDTAPEKRWDTAQFRAIVLNFLRKHEEFYCFVVGSELLFNEDQITCLPIIQFGGRSLLSAQYLVSRSQLFLGIDSCMLHVADFCRVPSVGLFGPTRAVEFGFRVGPNITFQGASGLSTIHPKAVGDALEMMARVADLDPQ